MILVDSQDASPIYEQVYRRIRTLIMTEALKEGEQQIACHGVIDQSKYNSESIQSVRTGKASVCCQGKREFCGTQR